MNRQELRHWIQDLWCLATVQRAADRPVSRETMRVWARKEAALAGAADIEACATSVIARFGDFNLPLPTARFLQSERARFIVAEEVWKADRLDEAQLKAIGLIRTE